MHVNAVVFLVLSVTLTSADITGQNPTTGTCLCLTGINVNARSSGSLYASVITTVSRPECYKFNGVIQTADGYTWYELQRVSDSTNGWVAGLFLSIGNDTHCTSSTSLGGACDDATAMDYACKLLALADAGNITLWKQHPSGKNDNAYAYNNVRDACHGQAASRSHYTCSECPSPGAPGGHVCLSATLLHYIYALHQNLGYIHVNEVAGACHTCGSKHYNGVAVDMHNPTPEQSAFLVSTCNSMGGSGQDEGNHVHCQFTS